MLLSLLCLQILLSLHPNHTAPHILQHQQFNLTYHTMSTMSSLLLLCLLCLSLNACTGRRLQVMKEKEFGTRQVLLRDNKDSEKSIRDDTTGPIPVPKVMKLFSPSNEHEERQETIVHHQKEIRKTMDGSGGLLGGSTTPTKPKNSKHHLLEDDVKEEPKEMIISSGSGITVSLEQKSAKIEGMQRPARSMLRFRSHIATKEKMETSDSNGIEDVIAMDYEQAHRKPPIHNLSP